MGKKAPNWFTDNGGVDCFHEKVIPYRYKFEFEWIVTPSEAVLKEVICLQCGHVYSVEVDEE
jgi:hypothetical protein